MGNDAKVFVTVKKVWKRNEKESLEYKKKLAMLVLRSGAHCLAASSSFLGNSSRRPVL